MTVVAHRIYHRQRMAGADFVDLSPDTLLLRAIKPPKQSETGLHLPDAVDDHPVRACVAFTVEKLPGVMSRGNPLDLQPGDTILARNAVVDPLYGNELGICDLYMGPVAVLERAPRPEG
jgi:hypothetical protein